ncbi:MAG: hypothetical protein WCQ50_13445 [Spirochaetota bacterium]
MQALLYWLQIGIAMTIGFLEPVAAFDGRGLVVRMETKALFTDRMRDLVAHGLTLTLDLDASLKVELVNGSTMRIYRNQRRSLRQDPLLRHYLLEDETGSREYADLDALEKAARRFQPFDFPLPAAWKSVSLFAKLRLVDDAVLSDRLGIPASELWEGYSPTIIKEWKATP